MRAQLLELLAPSVCPACDLPRRPGLPLLCARCRMDLRRLRQLHGIPSALAYHGTGARLIQRFKFEGRRDALAVLLEPLVRRSAELWIDAIVPVPRHRSRVRELGDDPVHTLARALGRRLDRPVLAGALRRSAARPPQTGLSPEARRMNVAGSFRARSKSLTDLRVLLLDDVVTTGATLSEALRTLREISAARSLQPMALAATPPPVLAG